MGLLILILVIVISSLLGLCLTKYLETDFAGKKNKNKDINLDWEIEPPKEWKKKPWDKPL